MANTINVVNFFSSLTSDRQEAIKNVAKQLVSAIGTVATTEHRDVKINIHGVEVAMRIKSVTKKGKAFVSFIKGKNSPAALQLLATLKLAEGRNYAINRVLCSGYESFINKFFMLNKEVVVVEKRKETVFRKEVITSAEAFFIFVIKLSSDSKNKIEDILDAMRQRPGLRYAPVSHIMPRQQLAQYRLSGWEIEATELDSMNLSPDINSKLASIGAFSQGAVDSMAAVFEGDNAYSINDATKSIARFGLNPSDHKSVSIGSKKVAVVVGVDMPEGYDKYSDSIYTSIVGGAIHASKEEYLKYGAMRVISANHAKGVAAFISDEFEAAAKDLSVQYITGKLKSKSVGLGYNLANNGKTLKDFIISLYNDSEFRTQVNNELASFVKEVKIGQLVYKVITIDEELHATSFYALEGWEYTEKFLSQQEEMKSKASIDEAEFELLGVEQIDEDSLSDEEIEALHATSVMKYFVEQIKTNPDFIVGEELLNMKREGLISKVKKVGRISLLTLDSIQDQFGEGSLKSFLKANIDNSYLVESSIMTKDLSTRIYEEGEIKFILKELFDNSIAYAGNGTLKAENFKSYGKDKAMIANTIDRLLNGDSSIGWVGLTNTGFTVEFAGYDFVFPGWNKLKGQIILPNEEDLSEGLIGGKLVGTLMSIYQMIKFQNTKGAVLTYAKHVLTLEQLFLGSRITKMRMTGNANMVLVPQTKDLVNVYTTNKTVRKGIQEDGQLGYIKYPELMLQSFKLVSAKSGTPFWTSTEEYGIFGILEESVLRIPPMLALSNQDDFDGDRATVFFAKGLDGYDTWTAEHTLGKDNLIGAYQAAYVADEEESLLKGLDIITDSTIKCYPVEEFQAGVEKLVKAKQDTGKYTNALVQSIPLFEAMTALKDGLTKEEARIAIASMGVAVQNGAISQMKHENRGYSLIDMMYLFSASERNAHDDSISLADAWEEAIESTIGNKEVARRIATIIAEKAPRIIEHSNMVQLGKVYSDGEYNYYNHYGVRATGLALSRMGFGSYMANLNSVVYSSIEGTEAEIKDYVDATMSIGRTFDGFFKTVESRGVKHSTAPKASIYGAIGYFFEAAEKASKSLKVIQAINVAAERAESATAAKQAEALEDMGF
jgi:hypothetical protein